ncbi:MAG: PQQ-dependent sugar dehydrogenase, partial [Segetibacter sp.]|nr:PQQ-dependent sugar dehydrogenase [Segetibacter sp.]
TLRIVSPSGLVSDTLRGLPRVYFRGDGGLLDIVLDPDFATNRTFYIAYVEQRTNGNGITVASAILSHDEFWISGVKVLFRVEPDYTNWAHYGSRLLFDKDGTLFISTGERTDAGIRVQAQWLSSHLGKLLRINKDGSPAKGNPSFPDSVNARPEVYAYGFRNGQALTFNPETGDLWELEHGPQGGDEINIIKPGKNYGWPMIAYGTEYSGNLINGGKSAQDGMEQPIYYWNPAIAPSGATFYTGSLIPEWKGNLFAAALAGQHISRLIIKNNKVVGEERLLLDQHQRMRDVKQAPDGALWVITDADNGRLIRITPK